MNSQDTGMGAIRVPVKLTNAIDNEVLIGQVILEKLDFLVDCKNQRLIPNPANPNYPVAMIK